MDACLCVRLGSSYSSMPCLALALDSRLIPCNTNIIIHLLLHCRRPKLYCKMDTNANADVNNVTLVVRDSSFSYCSPIGLLLFPILFCFNFCCCRSPKHQTLQNKTTTYGHEVDWWSFGVMAFELLFGFTPFTYAFLFVLRGRGMRSRFAIWPAVLYAGCD